MLDSTPLLEDDDEANLTTTEYLERIHDARNFDNTSTANVFPAVGERQITLSLKYASLTGDSTLLFDSFLYHGILFKFFEMCNVVKLIGTAEFFKRDLHVIDPKVKFTTTLEEIFVANKKAVDLKPKYKLISDDFGVKLKFLQDFLTLFCITLPYHKFYQLLPTNSLLTDRNFILILSKIFIVVHVSRRPVEPDSTTANQIHSLLLKIMSYIDGETEFPQTEAETTSLLLSGSPNPNIKWRTILRTVKSIAAKTCTSSCASELCELDLSEHNFSQYCLYWESVLP